MPIIKRTPEEIARQIAGLKKEKETLPEFSNFGDENWKKTDAMLDVLEGKAKPDDFYVNENAEEYEDGDNDIFFDADRAEQWLFGNETEDLYDSESIIIE
jgi:hypothetical protein